MNQGLCALQRIPVLSGSPVTGDNSLPPEQPMAKRQLSYSVSDRALRAALSARVRPLRLAPSNRARPAGTPFRRHQ